MEGGGYGVEVGYQVNKFEQVSSGDHQMSLAGGGRVSHLPATTITGGNNPAEQADANFLERFIYTDHACECENDVATWMGVLSILSRRQRY